MSNLLMFWKDAGVNISVYGIQSSRVCDAISRERRILVQNKQYSSSHWDMYTIRYVHLFPVAFLAVHLCKMILVVNDFGI